MLFKINTSKLRYQNGVAKVRKQESSLSYVTGPFSAGANRGNFSSCADWNGQDGNVTTVGTNGGPSFYGTYDQSGNVFEWNDLNNTTGSSRGLRGGGWDGNAFFLSSSVRNAFDPSLENDGYGFRLASPVPVPEP
jgi:formylglycine-generating enzyme required for sulfatase activity